MREKKFTEGPWFSFTEKNKVLTVSSSATRGEMEILEDEQEIDTSICGIWLHGVNVEEKEQNIANAALISAAPELLEALEKLRDCISETRGKDAYDAVDNADAAIAKAYGE